LAFATNANFYMGTGVSISQNQYEIKENYGSSGNLQGSQELQNAFNLARSAGTTYASSQYIQGVNNLTGQITGAGLAVTNINTASNGSSGIANYCVNNSVIIANQGGGGACPSGTTSTAATTQLVAQDIGNVFLNTYEDLLLKQGKTASFPSIEARIAFTEYFGYQILSQVSGTTVTATTPIADVATIITASPGGLFTMGTTNGNKLTITLTDDGNTLVTQQQLSGITTALLNTLDYYDVTVQAVDFPVLANSADSTGMEALLSVGYMKRHNNFYYGGEVLFEYGFTKIGKNSSSEIEVEYGLTASLLGRVGYGLSEKSFAYLNLGAALRRYEAKFDNSSDDRYIPHFLFGMGFEYNVTKHINVFTEFNYLVSLKDLKLKETINDDAKMQFKSQKLSVGMRYYFDKNVISHAHNNHNKEKTMKASAYDVTKSIDVMAI